MMIIIGGLAYILSLLLVGFWAIEKARKNGENSVKEKRDPDKVYIVWTAEDMKKLHPAWDDLRCKLALKGCEEDLIEASIPSGWDFLKDRFKRYNDIKE